MNEEQQGLAIVAIVIAFCCGGLLYICWLEEDNNDHPTHPRLSFQELIRTLKFSGDNPSGLPPVFIVYFNSKDFKDNVECVICLSDLVDGDIAKVLSSCNHLFHADCIDKWFESNSTCPICRNKVDLTQNHGLTSGPPPSTDANSSSQVVIDIPAHGT